MVVITRCTPDDGRGARFEDDLTYYRQRVIEERDRAATASEPTVAEIHLVLAARYEALIDEAKVRPTFSDDFGVAPA